MSLLKLAAAPLIIEAERNPIYFSLSSLTFNSLLAQTTKTDKCISLAASGAPAELAAPSAAQPASGEAQLLQAGNHVFLPAFARANGEREA